MNYSKTTHYSNKLLQFLGKADSSAVMIMTTTTTTTTTTMIFQIVLKRIEVQEQINKLKRQKRIEKR